MMAKKKGKGNKVGGMGGMGGMDPMDAMGALAGADPAALGAVAGAAGAALVLVTHDAALAERCGRVLTIEDGRIVQDRASSSRAA